MAAGVPPPPLNSPSGSYYWLEWYTNLTNFLNGTNIPWSNLNFGGSNLHDIQTRNHNTLQNIQGGNTTASATGTGLAYHWLAYGYCNATATSVTAPTGWTVVHSGTGTYTITHNLNLVLPAYEAGACSQTAGVIVTYVDTSSPNAIVVRMSPTSNFAALADGAFSWWIGNT